MRMELPEHVKTIIQKLESHGYEAYAVGGCVRDTLLGRTPGDWDITTSAAPQQVKAIFRKTVDTGIQHGTVTVILDHVGYEVTTYRIDGDYADSRHPSEVTFTSNLEEDLKRRDFTINAMAYNEKTGLKDCFGGYEDLQKGIIRCVGDPKERFGEDALRMLRAVRFSAQLGFSIEESTRQAVRLLAGNLRQISAERIQTELVKLLLSAHPDTLRTAWELDITAVILPEFDAMMDTEQHNPHHCFTVGEHTLKALTCVPADRYLRLGMLFHDFGKPLCLSTDAKGIDHFYGHPKESARLASEILHRLKFDNDTISHVTRIVRWHDLDLGDTPAEVRQAVHLVGEDIYPLLFPVKQADMDAQSTYQREEKQASLDRSRRIYEEVLAAGDCLSLKTLAVGGRDLIAAGIRPGPRIGEILEKLLADVLVHPAHNTREYLLSRLPAKTEEL